MKLRSRHYILIGIILAAICFAVVSAAGDTYVLRHELPEVKSAADYTIVIEDENVVALDGVEETDGEMRITLKAVSPGSSSVDVLHNEEAAGGISHSVYHKVYVHPPGIITEETIFGKCTGGWIITAAFLLFLLIILQSTILKYREGVRENMYSYTNVMYLGLIIFVSFMILTELINGIGSGSLGETVKRILNSGAIFSNIVLPVAFVVFLLVTVSNIKLMRNEGRNWHNMLGLILGILVLAGTLAPTILGEILQRSTVVDVHNEQGHALYVELAVENAVSAVVSYLECMLLGTIIFATKAARRVPAFDKDYMMILGCQVKEDGTLTNLLKGRADRAVEFARLQKEKTGKDLKFVPSGGKGTDETVSEGEAVKNYLLDIGIPADRIIAETGSANTYENFSNSMEMIRADAGEAEPKVAFSTTNYHVFRSGLIASEQGYSAEGIGSKTRSYFWVNAFIREFVATLSSERRKHIRIMIVLIIAVIIMSWMLRLSNVL